MYAKFFVRFTEFLLSIIHKTYDQELYISNVKKQLKHLN